jgi:hypothetical protein
VRVLIYAITICAATTCCADEAEDPVLKAKQAYWKESVGAIDAYLARETKARDKLAKAYDQAITAALRNGGEAGLDKANQLKADKQMFMEKQGHIGTLKMDGLDVPNDREIQRNLTEKEWTWYWNGAHAEAATFSPNGQLRLHRSDANKLPREYFVTLLWAVVLKSNQASDTEKHPPFILIMTDENTLRGFKATNGNRVGAGAAKK